MKRLVRSPIIIVVVLFLSLLIANIMITPNMLTGPRISAMAILLIPTMLAAMASVPSIMSGGGGLDLSVGPLLGFSNVILVGVLLPFGLGSAAVGIPLILMLGLAFGALNGTVIAYVRLQPIVVTLGSYLLLAGLSLVVLTQPRSGAPVWTATLAGSLLGGYVPLSATLLVAALVIWWLAKKLGFVGLISAVGSDERAAFASGVNVRLVRVGAYALGGLFAAFGGIGLTSLINSADPTAGVQYTLVAIVAVALGGNALGGGRGGMRGPLLAAACLYLIQALLSGLQVSSLWIQVVYGAVLLAAIVTNSALGARLLRNGAERTFA